MSSTVLRRRQSNRRDVETMKKVFAEGSFTNRSLELAVRRRKDANVDANRLAADPFERLLLQNSEQFGL